MHRLRSLIGRGVASSLLLCLPLTGCSVVARVTGSFEEPAIVLHASKVESLSLNTAHLLFTLVVHNPNSYTLHPQALRYHLTINQTPIADGNSRVTVSVPASGAASLDLPLEVSCDVLSNAAPDAMMLGEIPYELNIWMSVDSWFSAREIHFATSSVLRLNLPIGLADAGVVAFPVGGWQS